MGIDTRLLGEPVDATAAKVVRGKAWERNRASIRQIPLWHEPPRTIKHPKGNDYTGRKAGKFTVVGYLGKLPHAKPWWLCRCLCGSYEPRTEKAILESSERWADRCGDCRDSWFIRRDNWRKSYFNRHGKYPGHIKYEDGL